MTPAADRRSRCLTLGVLLASLAIYLPLLVPALFGARTFVDTGIVLRTEPWSTQAALHDQDHVTVANDTVDFYLPKLHVFLDGLHHGDLVTWDKYGSGGSPLASVPETASLSPLSAPYWVLPLSVAPAWVRLLEVLVAIGFTALFLRRLGLSSGASWAGGLVYSTTGFVVLWNNWPQAEVASLVPSLFWAVERLLQERRWRAAVPVGLSVAALLLSSFPAVVVYALYLLGPYVLVRTLGDRPRELVRRWLPIGAGLSLGVALAAFQVLPFVRYLATLDLGYRHQPSSAHPPLQALVTLVAPFAFGTETDLTYFGERNAVEDIGYVGVVAMVLVLLAVCLRVRTAVPARVTGFFLAASGVLVLVGWGSSTALGLAQHLPAIGTSYIGRIRVVLGLCLAVLAAIGAEKLVRLPESERPWQRWAAAPPVLAALLGVGALVSVHHTAVVRHQVGAFEHGLVVPGVVLVLVAALLVALLRRDRVGLVAMALLPVVVAVEAIAFVGSRWPSEDPDQLYPTTPVHAFLAAHLGNDRFGSAGSEMLPGSSTYYGLRSVGAHSFVSPTWHDEVAAVDPATASRPTLTLLGSTLVTATSPLLDRMATRYFVTPVEHPVFGTRIAPAPSVGVARDVQTVRARIAPGPLRAVVLGLAGPLRGGPRGSIEATFTDASGAVVGRAHRAGVYAGTTGSVPVPVVESAALSRAVSVTLTLDGLRGDVRTDAAGQPVIGLVRPADDGLRLVFADGADVYERLRAVPRVRIAGTAVVRPEAQQLATLRQGLPASSVVLASAPAGSGGGGGTATVTRDRAEEQRIVTSTTGSSWLVVADALQHGWVADVDGHRVPLVRADYSGVGVALPAGRHVVTLRYTAPGLRTGTVVSVLALLLVLGTALASRLRTGSAGYAGSRPGVPSDAPQGSQ